MHPLDEQYGLPQKMHIIDDISFTINENLLNVTTLCVY